MKYSVGPFMYGRDPFRLRVMASPLRGDWGSPKMTLRSAVLQGATSRLFVRGTAKTMLGSKSFDHSLPTGFR